MSWERRGGFIERPLPYVGSYPIVALVRAVARVSAWPVAGNAPL